MPDGIQHFFSHQELSQLAYLTLGSRFTVEGNLQGAHQSPSKGFSTEFADYRPYVIGDDLRHLDWKVYARNERLYIKQYEEEANLRAYFLVDASNSMGYGSGKVSKFTYAGRLASGLAYVTVSDQDCAGLTLFDEEIRYQMAPGSTRSHLRMLCNAMAEHTLGGETNVGKALETVAKGIRRRALVILLSDLYDDLDMIEKSLARFRRGKHDLIVYQVLDPAELEFPFTDLGHFEDMETGTRVLASPAEIRRAYQEEIAAHISSCRQLCEGLNIDYQLVTTHSPVVRLIRQHMSRRQTQAR